jgi:hypothetical protein
VPWLHPLTKTILAHGGEDLGLRDEFNNSIDDKVSQSGMFNIRPIIQYIHVVVDIGRFFKSHFYP